MGPKYEFTDKTMNYDGHTLHRIHRIEDGKLGGWIESEENLSQEGSCWVDDNAKVYDDADVYGNAKVYGDACVSWVAEVYGNAKVYENARVFGNAKVSDNAKIYGHAKVYDNAHVYGVTKIYGNAKIYGDAEVSWGTKVYDNAQVYGVAKLNNYTNVYGNAHVYSGNTIIWDYAEVNDDAKIYDEDSSKNSETNKVVQDFIYKVNDSNKLTAQTEYDSVDEFFSEPITNDVKLDTLIICTVDTKEPLIKLQKVEAEDKTEFKFIIDIINEDNDNFMFKSIIKSQEQLSQLIQKTIEALRLYPKFNKYADDLEEYL